MNYGDSEDEASISNDAEIQNLIGKILTAADKNRIGELIFTKKYSGAELSKHLNLKARRVQKWGAIIKKGNTVQDRNGRPRCLDNLSVTRAGEKLALEGAVEKCYIDGIIEIEHKNTVIRRRPRCIRDNIRKLSNSSLLRYRAKVGFLNIVENNEDGLFFY